MLTFNPPQVAEIAPDVFRFSLFAPPLNLQFNFFLVRDDEPLLFTTGLRATFPLLRQAVATVIDPATIRWVGFSHFESDECGAMNQWLETAPHAEPVCGMVSAMVNMNDFANRPARGLMDGQFLETGKYRFRFCATPQLPHGWDAGLLFEETQRTLFCSDLFHQEGDPRPITSEDLTESVRTAMSRMQASPLAGYIPYTAQTSAVLAKLAALNPQTLAIMHGSSYTGDGGAALTSLADIMRAVLVGRDVPCRVIQWRGCPGRGERLMFARASLILLSGMTVMAAEPSVQVFEKKTLADRTKNQPAALTLLAPKGWNVTGGPKWYPTFVHQVSFEVTVAAPDGVEQVEILPTYWFTHSPGNPFPPRPLDRYMGQVWLEPHRPVDMLERVSIPGLRSAVRPRIIEREELPELARGFAREDGQTVQAGRVRIAYDHKGRPVEEDLYIVLTYFTLRTANGPIVNWSPAIMPFAIRAAAGKLSAASPRLLTTAFSIQPTPAYYKELRIAQTRFIGNMAEVQRLDRLDAQAVFQTRSDINAIYQNIWKERAASNERTFQTRQDLLGGIAPYRGTDATFLLPHTHKVQWASADGTTVILTDDVNFDPNIQSRFHWERLRESQR